jgi:hypothetical protein
MPLVMPASVKRRLTPRGHREPHPIPVTKLLLSLMSKFIAPCLLAGWIAGLLVGLIAGTTQGGCATLLL